MASDGDDPDLSFRSPFSGFSNISDLRHKTRMTSRHPAKHSPSCLHFLATHSSLANGHGALPDAALLKCPL